MAQKLKDLRVKSRSQRDVPLGSPSPLRSQSGENCCLCVKYFCRGELAKWSKQLLVCVKYFCTDMSSSSLVTVLLCAPIMGQISALLNATVGGSVLFPCSLPVNSTSIKWFYWQEDGSDKLLFHWDKSGETQPVADEYRNRCQVFNTEFSSGNISIKLNNVSVGDDQKTFWASVRFDSTKPLDHQCKSSLQVSAPYQDLVLTINSTLNSATCTAHGGYPEPEVKWTGQNKFSSEQLKLKDAQTSHQQHPTKKTFSVTSTVSVKELQSVTCHVCNPHSKQQIKNTAVIDAPGKELLSIICVSIGVIAAILLFVCVFYRRRKKSEEERQQAVNQEDLAANEVPADGNAPHGPSNSSEGDVSEGRVLLNHQTVSSHFSVKRDADDASNEDTTAAAVTADTEEKTKLLSDSKEDSDETKSTESDKDK
ncbi:butyrophilin-like protein 9 isoform X2 [Thunnus maccoyii]|uniref:butyrophilin-like protein 9 isoform X2 n=1 Tax=Thunnus maccoyii TaxID=8240 RepID=UPI001C4D5055|nr:butyrophilin-like protein 9 isoform X2 [Thunnus maccoyii]XP_042281975.1 butyrophilin-like protein 9 isoform X2 [Thunnus maccoyii]